MRNNRKIVGSPKIAGENKPSPRSLRVLSQRGVPTILSISYHYELETEIRRKKRRNSSPLRPPPTAIVLHRKNLENAGTLTHSVFSGKAAEFLQTQRPKRESGGRTEFTLRIIDSRLRGFKQE
uniref:Uncharacterized protein n=1 Tax=Leptospira ellisii TaxID=2023197 RepID=A0A2N0BBR4_9LEPT|nr:hypothetical protein CH379_04980 [Leptospira ellisii]